MKNMDWIIIAAVIGIAAIILMYPGSSVKTAEVKQDTAEIKANPTSPPASDEYVTISLSETTSNIKTYTLKDGGTDISYLVVLGSDGKPRTALDACVVCGGKKGYRQEGDEVVCNNCGRHFSIDDLGTANKGGGCWPVHLDHEVVDGNILIKKSDIIAGEGLF